MKKKMKAFKDQSQGYTDKEGTEKLARLREQLTCKEKKCTCESLQQRAGERRQSPGLNLHYKRLVSSQ